MKGEQNSQLITVGFRAALFLLLLAIWAFPPLALCSFFFVLHRRISFDLATLIESIVSQLGQFSLSLFVCTSTLLSALEHISTLLKMQTTTATARAQVPRLLWLGDRLRFTHTHTALLFTLLFAPSLLFAFACFFPIPFRCGQMLSHYCFSVCVCVCFPSICSLKQVNGTEKW